MTAAARSFATALCVALLLVATLAHGQPAGQAEHFAAVRRMLVATEIPKTFLRGFMEKSDDLGSKPGKDPLFVAALDEIYRGGDEGAILDRFVPIWAPYYSTSVSNAIAEFFSTAAGKKVLEGVPLSGVEREQFREFRKTPAYSAWGSMPEAMLDEMGRPGADWARALVEARFSELHGLRRAFERRIRERDAQTTAEAEALSDGLIDDEVLVDKAAIEKSMRNVTLLEGVSDSWFREKRAMLDDYEAQVRRSAGTGSVAKWYLARLDARLAPARRRITADEAADAKVIAIYRRVLSLARERHGRLHLKKGELVFDLPADRITYEDLIRQLQEEVARQGLPVREGS